MKKSFIILAGLALVCSCVPDHRDSQMPEASVYFTDNTASKGVQKILMYDVQSEVDAPVYVYCAGLNAGEAKVQAAVATDYIEYYNKINFTEYKALPEDCYTLVKASDELKGRNASFELNFNVANIMALSQEPGVNLNDYVVALKLAADKLPIATVKDTTSLGYYMVSPSLKTATLQIKKAAVATDYIEYYNKINFTEYKALPEDCYTLVKASDELKGRNASFELNFNVANIMVSAMAGINIQILIPAVFYEFLKERIIAHPDPAHDDRSLRRGFLCGFISGFHQFDKAFRRGIQPENSMSIQMRLVPEFQSHRARIPFQRCRNEIAPRFHIVRSKIRIRSHPVHIFLVALGRIPAWCSHYIQNNLPQGESVACRMTQIFIDCRPVVHTFFLFDQIPSEEVYADKIIPADHADHIEPVLHRNKIMVVCLANESESFRQISRITDCGIRHDKAPLFTRKSLLCAIFNDCCGF